MPNKLTGLLLSDFTIDVGKSFLENISDAPSCQITLGPFGPVLPVLMDDNHPIWKQTYDFVVIWTQAASAIPSFRNAIHFQTVQVQELNSEGEDFIHAVKLASKRSRLVFVVSFGMPDYVRGLGPIDLRPNGIRHTLLTLNKQLADGLSDASNVYLLSLERWLQSVGEKACDPRLWLMGKIPYDPLVFKLAATDIKAALRACLGQTRKLIVLDLDNTLWGGIVGDDGYQNLHIGGHDPQGEAYAEFQRTLKNFKQRGILLAIASKNQEAVALEALDRHPEMVLKKSDFAGIKINWQDKAQNIAAILKELNLTPEAAVFIDDNPVERDRVAQALPGILVPAWPANCLLYTKTLLSLNCFDTVHISDDDKRRTAMYAEEHERKALQGRIQNQDEWLASLKTKVQAKPLSDADLPRATQLLNKTNQMNLSTRRLSESELMAWSKQPGRQVTVFRTEDRLGDSGLIGIASFECLKDTAQIIDFVLSCRVFGRQIENVMTQALVEQARRSKLTEIRASYMKTEKNQPCLEFLKERSGFKAQGPDTFVWDLKDNYPLPAHITVEHG